jgi:hypothetical protein
MWGQPPSPALSGVEGAVRRAQPGCSCEDTLQSSVSRMRTPLIIAAGFLAALLFSSCSPRDFLTRRLAADLISGSNAFKTPQPFWLRTGIMSNKDYLSPEYLVLQHHGWISATNAACPPALAPPPCWDVLLTPSGVDTVRGLLSLQDVGKASFNVPAARRQLVEVVGISKQGNVGDVEFIWRWVPLNELGAALYSTGLRYRSTVGFRYYDDGWRILQAAPRPAQTLDEALKNAEASQ